FSFFLRVVVAVFFLAAGFFAAGFLVAGLRLGFSSTAASAFGAGGGGAGAVGASTSRTVMWHVRLWIRATRPRARARQRFIVGPSSAYAAETTMSSGFRPARSTRDSAFATAEFSTFSTSRAIARCENARI